MKKIVFLFVATLVTLSGCVSKKTAATPGSWTEAESARWFDRGEWLGKTRLKPHPSINKKEFAAVYHKHKDWWDTALKFLDTANIAAMPVGDHELVGKDVFVRVSEYSTKNPENAFYESHQFYSDIHEVITGTELIGTTTEQLSVKTPYNAERDITFHNGTDQKTYVATPGTIFIFFPGEFHRPSMKVAENIPVKKAVVKIRN
jgi:YhcH/YjgK/YiaL family protein